jgi:HrpA-like RNA helicase
LTFRLLVGKSVLVPQWVYDHLFIATGFGHRRVAVLVPRRAIAENLAAYVSQIRGGELGEEVGLGIDGDVRMSDHSRLIFMTYGFFRAISVHDPHFSQWGAVILDEAHERKTDADAILARLGAACRARPEFLAIVMSATIDVEVYRAALVGGWMPRAPPKLKVEGVTFPVKQVWWDGEPWRPSEEGGLANLAVETVRVLNKEPDGNVLIFLSTTSAVLKLVEELQKLLRHQPGVVIYPLYASMSSQDKSRVMDFGDLSKHPHHRGKRLVCVSTNVAEAGITIAGISTVIDTGWELEMVFDHVTKRTSAREVRISEASQVQRRGRAGRTRPGSCYCMYSEADFTDHFPEYGTPEILKSNLENFALGMLAAGFDPLTLEILDRERAKERLEAGVARLKSFRAVEVGKNGKLAVTELGRKLARLPLELNLALCVLAASAPQLGCSYEVAIIVCMSQMASLRLFEKGRNADKARFAAPSGDHETYLAVFEAWAQGETI